MATDTDYCGCCGRETHGYSTWWCADCAKHIDRTKQYAHNQTYIAQHDKDCPFQETANPLLDQCRVNATTSEEWRRLDGDALQSTLERARKAEADLTALREAHERLTAWLETQHALALEEALYGGDERTGYVLISAVKAQLAATLPASGATEGK